MGSKLTYNELLNAIDKLPNLYLYAAPLMLLSVLVEYIWARYTNQNIYKNEDVLPSLLIGFGYVCVTLLVTTFTFYMVWFFYFYLSYYTLPRTPLWFLFCFVVYDFFRYWAHRMSHQQRFWWATHSTHHSSEQYNLLVAFRLSWVDQLKVVFFIPVLLLGFDPTTFFLAHQLSNIIQFWQHTGLRHRLPSWVEYIFITPRLHQVHHAINADCIDKNYGSIFVIWDKLFKTYRAPIDHLVYGITTPVASKNPIYLVFHGFYELIVDAKKTNSVRGIWTMLWSKPK